MDELNATLWKMPDNLQFNFDGDNIDIMLTPAMFYQRLRDLTCCSEHRIIWSALYLGVDAQERQLVQDLRGALCNNRRLRFTALFDHARGLRSERLTKAHAGIADQPDADLPTSMNTVDQLRSILDHYDDRTRLFLYQSPALRGFARYCLPNRYNELVGVQHMKFFVFDDNVVITGANLSRSYFTNRQDRYMMIKNCKPLADFLSSLVFTVGSFSYRYENRRLVYPSKVVPHPQKDSIEDFACFARSSIRSTLLHQEEILMSSNKNRNATLFDTTMTPFIEAGQLGIIAESEYTKTLLKSLPKRRVVLATGYFNMLRAYAESLRASIAAPVEIVVASPKANGFFGSSGPSGAIPAGYARITDEFFRRYASRNKRILIREWHRPTWTFHAKGLWIFDHTSLPNETLIGSSNFGYRSTTKDFELQFHLKTNNSQLQCLLKKEVDNIVTNTAQLTKQHVINNPLRRPPLWGKFVVRYFRYFF